MKFCARDGVTQGCMFLAAVCLIVCSLVSPSVALLYANGRFSLKTIRNSCSPATVARQVLQAAVDLTPAVERYPRVPLIKSTSPLMGSVWVAKGSKVPPGPDPFVLVKSELRPFTDNIKALVENDNPVLSTAAKHFFEQRHGKRFRPTVVALISKASAPGLRHEDTEIYQKQGQLGQITEMIHVASLIHDDVLDDADMRRGGLAVHKLYTNKVAVLAGDYLLARASVLLARLGNVEVVELMASALDSLVQGELMQVRLSEEDLCDMNMYLRKSYYKTASLICNSCKSATLLSGYTFDSETAQAAEKYGYHMGIAFQVVDDILDITGTSSILGKPAMTDVSLGLATAPLLYASEQFPSLRPLIKRRFKQPGDVQTAFELTMKSDGVQRSYELAQFHAQSAVDVLQKFPPSESRDALARLCHIVLNRDA